MRQTSLFFIIVSVLMASCKASREQQTAIPQPSAAYTYLFQEGVRKQVAGDLSAAFDLYSHAMAIDSMQPEVKYMLAQYYAELGDDSTSIQLLEQATGLNPTNSYYNEMLANQYVKMQELDKAIDVCEKLYLSGHTRYRMLQYLTQLYQYKKDNAMLIETYNRMDREDGQNDERSWARMYAYEQLGDTASAYGELKQMVDNHPYDINYKIMLGNWLLQHQRTEEAMQLFVAAEADDPDNEAVRMSFYDYYRINGNDSLACVYRDGLLLSRKTAAATKVTLLRRVLRMADSMDEDSIVNLFEKVTENTDETAEISILQYAYMHSKNRPVEQLDSVLMRVLDKEPDNAMVRQQLIADNWERQDWDKIIELAKPALEYNPDDMVFCYFLGLGYYQKEDKDNALATFKRGISQIKSDSKPDMVSDLYAIMGDILHSNGQRQEAYEAYDNCLKYNADNVGCLNNYAYYLCEEDSADLRKAEQMSQKTVQKEPLNVTFLDTYAWILYLQERYMEALSIMQHALNNIDKKQDNATIYYHAGDIYYACDELDKALEYWTKSLEGNPDNPDIIRKKIEDNRTR